MGDIKIKLSHSGLKEGEYSFSFKIENDFFEQFDTSEFKKGNVQAGIVLYRRSRIIELEIMLKGKVEAECDLCLDLFEIPISYKAKMYVKFGQNKDEENEELIVVGENENEIDLTQYVYESICLSVPYRKVHNENSDGTGGCNQAMIEKLQQLSVKNEKQADPRWDQLKNIKN